MPLKHEAERLLPRAHLDQLRPRRADDPGARRSATASSASCGRRTSRTPTTRPSTSTTSTSSSPRSPRTSAPRSSAATPAACSSCERGAPMIRRVGKNLGLLDGPVPDGQRRAGARRLHRAARRARRPTRSPRSSRRSTGRSPSDPTERNRTDRDEFRYQMLNHGPRSQEVVGHPAILAAIEPLLGGDCHVIANTAWRNPPTFTGGPWHCDAGPHVPRPGRRRVGRPHPVPGVRDRRPHHAARLPAGVRADGGRPGQPPLGPPRAEGAAPRSRPHLRRAPAGAAHRRRPATCACSCRTRGTAARRRRTAADGRLFLQVHYGRRDIAQRLRPTAEANQLTPEACAGAVTPRQRALVGLHDAYFYDG